MIIETYQCDGCGKIVANRYAEPGWVFFERPTVLRIAKGVYENKSYKAHYLDHVTDFCSAECMSKFADLDKVKDPKAT